MSAFVRIICVVGALLLVTQLSLGQTTVTVSPASKTVNMPDQFTINVMVNNVTGCRAANIKISFNNTILTYNSLAKGPFLADAFGPSPLVVPNGSTTEITYDQSVLGTNTYSGSGVLVTYTFTATAVGTTPITLITADLRDVNGTITLTKANGSVTVDPPLPIQLSSFTAALVGGTNHVLLSWKTLSETDNLGFEVQRSLEPLGPFESIAGSFIEGHGTTIEPQEYSYTDVNTEGKSWYYRLKQMDRSGAVNYSDAVQAILTAVAEEKAMPTVYSLDQNYPNPFNPSTVISYQLPSAGSVRLVVYDLLGKEVATLVNGMREAGYHKESFNASGLGSGLYFYQLTAGDQTFLKKMMVVK